MLISFQISGMPNYAQAAIQIRQKKEREAKEKEIRSQKDHRPARDNEKVSIRRRGSIAGIL